MKKYIVATLGLFGFLALVPTAQASLRTYSPTAGTPWTPGVSSFDWTNWSYADNVLVNNAGSDRTWTVPFVTDNAVSGVAQSVWAVIANSASGFTTGQGVSNFGTGARFTSLSPVFAPSTALTDTFLGNVTVPFDGTAYINLIVGRTGGRVARVEINQ